MVPRTQFDRSREINTDLEARIERTEALLAQTQAELGRSRQQSEAALARLQTGQEVQSILEQRVDNLRRETDRLHAELTTMVFQAADAPTGSPGLLPVAGTDWAGPEISKDLLTKFAAVAKARPGTSFLEKDRMFRMRSEVVFLDGSDRIGPEARALFQDLAVLYQQPAVSSFNLLIVGHTSRQSKVLAELMAQHPTDWHLAAHQAIAVQQYLEELGVAASRIGIVSYGSQQPLVSGQDDVAHRDNARIEVYLTPPDPR